MLPSSGESWDTSWTLNCNAAKKRGLDLAVMGQGREQRGGAERVYSTSLSLSLSLNPTLFLFCVCVLFWVQFMVILTTVTRRFNGGRMNA